MSGQVGVVFDRMRNEQSLLHGHRHAIVTTAVSANRQWIVTADRGEDSTLVVWDSKAKLAVRTYFDTNKRGGICSVDMSHDAMYVITLSDSTPQQICLWDWTSDETSEPMMTTTLPASIPHQTSIVFNTENPRQIVSNGSTQAVFYWWEYGGQLEHYLPDTTLLDPSIASFRSSLFLPGTSRAVTSTNDGKLVIWHEAGTSNVKSVQKTVSVAKCALTSMAVTRDYLAVGTGDGSVRFYDYEFRIVSWNDSIQLGPITAISFAPAAHAKAPATSHSRRASLQGGEFVIPNYILATSKGCIVHVAPSVEDWMTVVVRSQEAPITAIAAHPSRHHLAVASYAGVLQIWNYETRELELSSKLADGLLPESVAFSSDGDVLAVGLTNGYIHLLDALSLTLLTPTMKFRVAQEKIHKLVFSPDSNLLAFADGEKAVGYIERQRANTTDPWKYTGRFKSHSKPIIDILFGVDSHGKNILYSIGQDRMTVEYDLELSSFDGGLKLKGPRVRTEQIALPTAIAWYPSQSKTEQLLLTANSEAKFKMFNSVTKMCRKTVVGPVLDAPVDRLLPLTPTTPNETVIAFTAHDKVGVTLVPLDGNVHRHMASIAHPDRVVGLVSSFDGQYVFTAGASTATIHVWQVNPTVLAVQTALGGTHLDPFLTTLEGGKDGAFVDEIKNYFYYSQIRAQGEDSMESRQVGDTIPLSEIPALMRALGYFPSEQQTLDMLNEVKFSRYSETNKLVADISLDDFIRLYINHKPAHGVTSAALTRAFQTLSHSDKDAIDAKLLLQQLMSKGERITEADMSKHLATLVGDASLSQLLQGDLTSEQFSQKILGLI